MEIPNKTILITGGASGLGKEMAKTLSTLGARVGVLDIQKAGLERLASEVPGVWTLACDISDPAQVEDAAGQLSDKNGSIDVLVNNAGVIHNAPLIGFKDGRIETYPIADWNRVLSTNLSGVFYMTAAVAKRMAEKRGKGLIVNVSSVSAAGNAGQSAYAAAKAGVNALTVAWAKELGPWKIRVAGLAPGYTRTETTLNSMKPDVLSEWEKKTPVKRLGEPAEIVAALLFIIGDDFYNGRTLEVDGGLRI